MASAEDADTGTVYWASVAEGGLLSFPVKTTSHFFITMLRGKDCKPESAGVVLPDSSTWGGEDAAWVLKMASSSLYHGNVVLPSPVILFLSLAYRCRKDYSYQYTNGNTYLSILLCEVFNFVRH